MKMEIMKSSNRGLMKNKEFKGYSLFSNGERNSGRKDNFGAIYVFNDDYLYPNSSLGMHPHANVEIVTVMISGRESHKDTLGIHDDYEAGDVQLISSGSGLYHSGGNLSPTETARHLQIWVAPKTLNTHPTVQVKKNIESPPVDGFQLLVSPDGINDSLKINQDVWIERGFLEHGKPLTYSPFRNTNGVLIYIVKGSIYMNNVQATDGDTIFLKTDDNISINPLENSEILLIETTM